MTIAWSTYYYSCLIQISFHFHYPRSTSSRIFGIKRIYLWFTAVAVIYVYNLAMHYYSIDFGRYHPDSFTSSKYGILLADYIWYDMFGNKRWYCGLSECTHTYTHTPWICILEFYVLKNPLVMLATEWTCFLLVRFLQSGILSLNLIFPHPCPHARVCSETFCFPLTVVSWKF